SLPTIHFPLDKTSLYLRNAERNVPLNPRVSLRQNDRFFCVCSACM
ncbi:unnamed protein product, partial [Callosobruchus maculatus]